MSLVIGRVLGHCSWLQVCCPPIQPMWKGQKDLLRKVMPKAVAEALVSLREGHLQSLSESVGPCVKRAGGSPALRNPRESKEKLSLAGSTEYLITNIGLGLQFYQKLVSLGRSLEGLN